MVAACIFRLEKDVCFQWIDAVPLASLALGKDFCFPVHPRPVCLIYIALVPLWTGGHSGFETEPALIMRERRHSHISGPDRESPLAMTGGEMESGLWWAFYFSETHWLRTGFDRHKPLMRGTDKCLYFPRWQFSVPRCNAHWAERLMGKEMKLKTRSQLRRVIGKVCSNGSLWNVRSCSSCRYSPDEAKGGEDYESSAQEAIFTQPEEECGFGNWDEEGSTPSTWEDSIKHIFI